MRVRVIAIVIGSFLAAAGLEFACGGKVRGFPIVDPDGNVSTADGDTYGPGMCEGFDGSTWLVPNPSCPPDADPYVDTTCTAWGHDSYPEGRGVGYCTNGTCTRSLTLPSWNASCDQGTEGDAYCRAIVQPFLRTFTPAYVCVRRSMGGPPTSWTQCDWDTRCSCFDGRICVDPGDGGVGCVPPCE